MPLAPRITRRTAALALFAAAVASTTGCFGLGKVYHKERREIEAVHVPASPLRVSTANGAITVQRGDTPTVAITADLKAETVERLQAAQVVASREPDGSLFITVEWPDGRHRGGEGCSFLIRLPDANGVQLRTSNGALSLTGFSGEAVLETSNGSLTVNAHDGPVRADTSNGRITLTGIRGDAHADTSNGRIEIDGLSGALDADTSNGAVDVRLDPASPGPVRIETSNGGVTLRVGPAFTGELSLGTSNGKIRFDGLEGARILSASKKSARLALGSSSARSTIDTSNGTITVEGGAAE